MTHVLSTKIITISLSVLLCVLLVLGFISPVQAVTYTLSDLLGSSSVATIVDDDTFSVSSSGTSVSIGSFSGGSSYILSGVNSASISFTVDSFSLTSYSGGSLNLGTNGTPTSISGDGSPYSSSSNTVKYLGSDLGTMHTVTVDNTNGGATYFRFNASRTSGSTSDTSASYTITINDITLDGVSVFGNTSTPATSSFSIPYGNVAVLDLTRTTISLDLSTTFREKSSLFGSPFPDYGYWGTMSTLPGDGYIFEQSSSNTIVWAKGQPRDILGATYNGVYTLDSTSLNRFLYIVNPYTSAPSPDGILPSITVSGVPSGVVVYTYPLSSTLSNYGAVISTLEDTSLGGSGEATASGGAINFTDGNGDVYTSPDGGLNAPSESVQSVVDYVNSISKTLDNFVEAFLNLLKAPISHIQQLVSSGSAFMQSLSTMFTWLPDPVQAVITSGLVLLVVIGVLKLLL